MTKSSELASVLLARAESDQQFMASAFATWQHANPELKLHEVLHCDQEDIWRIGLAQRPKSDAHFSEAAKRIADAFGVHLNALVALLRLTNSLDSLREAGTGAEGMLTAARDRLENKTSQKNNLYRTGDDDERDQS